MGKLSDDIEKDTGVKYNYSHYGISYKSTTDWEKDYKSGICPIGKIYRDSLGTLDHCPTWGEEHELYKVYPQLMDKKTFPLPKASWGAWGGKFTGTLENAIEIVSARKKSFKAVATVVRKWGY